MKTTFINSPDAQYTDSEFSWYQDIVLQTGYFALQDGTKTFQVVQKSPTSLGINVNAGKLLLPFSKGSVDWKIIVESNAVQPFTITPNSSGANRIDAVIVKLATNVDPDALKTNIASVQVIQGTGTVALTDGAIQTIIGANFVFTRLADITVATGATDIVDANIINLLEKVKISKAVNVDADSVISYSGSATPNEITANAPSAIADKDAVSLIAKNTYTTDTTVNPFETVGTATTMPGDIRPNCRAGIYTLQGFDYFFFLDATVLYYRKRVAGTNTAWGTRVSTGVQVFNNLDGNWTIGCDGANNIFHLCYNKNAGVSDGKLYYRMLTVPVGGVITVGTEVVAWTDTLFTFTGANSGRKGLDSEFVNDAYYVVFQNNDVGGNYKATFIANTASNGTWVMKSGLQIDLDSTYGEYHNGGGCTLGCIGAKKIGFLWYKRTAVAGVFPDYIFGYPAYKEYNTVTGSSTAVDVITNLPFNGSPSYDYDMIHGNNTVSFQDGVVMLAVQRYDSSGQSAYPMNFFKKRAFNTWDQISFTGGGITQTGLGFSTRGNKSYYLYIYNYSGGGASQAVRLQDTTAIWAARNQIFNDQTQNYFNTSMMRAVQNGKGIHEAIGYMFRQGTGYAVWYTKDYAVANPYLETTDWNNANSRAQFVGFAKGAISAGGSGTAVILGNFLTGDTDIIPNRKYYVSGGGITPYKPENAIYIGLGSSAVSIELDIKNSEDLSDPNYVAVVINGIMDYDGIHQYTIADTNGGGSGTSRTVYIPVKAGDTVAGLGGGASPTLTYRRTQK